MENLSFYYGNKKILYHINVNINKNETVAFVGESGSGKTTIVSIIAGLLSFEHDDLLIDGQSIREYNLRSYQNKIGYVTQDPDF